MSICTSHPEELRRVALGLIKACAYSRTTEYYLGPSLSLICFVENPYHRRRNERLRAIALWPTAIGLAGTPHPGGTGILLQQRYESHTMDEAGGDDDACGGELDD